MLLRLNFAYKQRHNYYLKCGYIPCYLFYVLMVFLLLITSSVSYVYSFKQTCSYKISYVKAGVASGGWVPMGQGAATAIHPKAEEHPQAYQPATQPRAPLAQPPHYSTRHTEARSPVEVN